MSGRRRDSRDEGRRQHGTAAAAFFAFDLVLEGTQHVVHRIVMPSISVSLEGLLEGTDCADLVQTLFDLILAVFEVAGFGGYENEAHLLDQERGVEMQVPPVVESGKTNGRRARFGLLDGRRAVQEIDDQMEVLRVKGVLLQPHDIDQLLPRQQQSVDDLIRVETVHDNSYRVPDGGIDGEAEDGVEEAGGEKQHVVLHTVDQTVDQVCRISE